MSLTIKPLAVVAMGMCLWLAPTVAAAQGFFQQLFGGGPPAIEAPQSRPAPMLTPGGRPYQLPYAYTPRQRSSDDDDDRDTRGGKYKTVCVRMCDGYFFPISNSTTKRGFYRDQMRCRASCGDDARLFHVPAGSTEMSMASDGQGRIYGLLAVANRHKKTVVPGCQCRPDPWSAAELGRHAQYAVADAEKLAAERTAQLKLSSNDKTIGEKAATAGDLEPKEDVAPVADSATKAPITVKAAARSNAASRPATQRSAHIQAQIQAQIPATRPPQPASPAPVASAGFGGGYSWPGDAPRR
jgi:hypothetical protein